uniref:Arf-GAP with coiled-coil, ANK repeat and PH domain-containing protein n=1 Tax=Denticeps clupeoides TaxID=299321 RepID=A0AAY4C858_9TELE
MTIKLDFEECLKDSPRFRADIEDVEGDVSELETRLDKVRVAGNEVKQSGTAERLLGTFSLFSFSLTLKLGIPKTIYPNTEEIANCTLGAGTLNIHGSWSTSLRCRDVKRLKDVRKEFERSGESLEAALSRNAQAPRNKAHEVDEASAALLNSRRTEIILAVSLPTLAPLHVPFSMLSLMEAQAQFFHKGHESLKELESYRKSLNEEDVSYDDSLMGYCTEPANGIAMEGYLYKRASNAFKTWNRRWFSIQKNQLVYQKKFKEQPTVVVEDLRLCTVKPCPDHERRFCFEVVSPSKSCLLQADSDRLQQDWISAVQLSIASAFQDRREDSHSPRDRCSSVSVGSGVSAGAEQEVVVCQALEEVQGIPGNGFCCDCGESGPDWASINLGITLCITCSGIHRSLGVHFSKVRSLTLDSWEPELIKLMCELGNTAINRIYEARIDEMTIKKPHPSSPRQDKESWIRSKYVEKKFIQKLPETGGRWSPKGSGLKHPPTPGQSVMQRGVDSDEEDDLSSLHPGALLYRSAALQHFPVMADAIAHGADVNWVNAAEASSTPLIQAATANSLAACEFLLQNGANVNQVDVNGRGPLHHATILGHTGLVCLFLKRGADYNAKDKTQKDPISIAVESANADIVTLLRIAKMNKEMREMDGAFGQSGDDTYHDIFRDFSHMASNNPEKLKRRSADIKTP